MANSGLTVADEASGENWHAWNGDCVQVARSLPSDSVDYTIYSPPFQSLYTFSDDPRDMSNCKSGEEFFAHYRFLIAECFRLTKPGRLVSIHCMNLPTSKLRDGFIGLSDFRGQIIKAHQEAGFYFHSEVMIRKDPVAAMQRSKAIGLLHKQVMKDSSMSRMAVPDTIVNMYKPNSDFGDEAEAPAASHIVTMRKPGDNAEPIDGPFDRYYGAEAEECGPLKIESDYFGTRWLRPGDEWYSVAVWQRYAEPVWLDIAQSDVLSRKEAREEKDEAHIAPLQLTPIRRCIDLWSNPGDTVFSPFAGIGSELYVALQQGRKAMGAELKPSYFRQLVANCERAKSTQNDIFNMAAAS